MRKRSKKLYVALVVILCFVIALVACSITAEVEEQGEKNTQKNIESVLKTTNEGKEDSDTDQTFDNTEVSEKEDDNRRNSKNKTTVSLKNKNSAVNSTETGKTAEHFHSWEAVYAERVVYEPVDVYGVRCNNCGYSTTSASALYNHIDSDPFDNCGSYSTGVVIGTEQKAVTESYVSGYKCSCGAQK